MNMADRLAMSNYNTISDALFDGFTKRIQRLERILLVGIFLCGAWADLDCFNLRGDLQGFEYYRGAFLRSSTCPEVEGRRGS